MPHRSAGKSENDADNDQMLEAELQKLCHHHRVLEKDRESYQHEAMGKIRVQKREIELLEKEQEEHKKNLKLAESEQNQNKNKEKADELKKLVEERDAIEADIDELAQEEKRLKEQLKGLEKCHGGDKKGEQGSSMSPEEARNKNNKQISTLENKLAHELKKFSNQLQENRKLRKEVDSARNEKSRFDKTYEKLLDHNESIKIEMGRAIEAGNIAYEQREDAQNKIISGKEKADKEEVQHQSEMRELQRCIDHEKKLREFMDIKKCEREEDEFTKAHKKKKEEELRLKKEREGKKNTAEMYERACREIYEIVGQEPDENCENLDEVVRKFIENEQRNFALFEYINEQNNNIENLKDEIDKIDQDEAQCKKNEQKLDSERQKKLQEIEAKQAQVSKLCDEAEEKIKVYEKVLEQLRKAIYSLFEKIDCPRDSIDELLGSSAGIKDNNMMQYLGIIEQKTNELLTIKAYLDCKNQEKQDEQPTEKPHLSLLGDGPKPITRKAEIIPPSTGGDGYGSDEGSDDEIKPLSVEELRQRALRNVSRREREIARMNTQNEFQTSEKKKQGQRKR